MSPRAEDGCQCGAYGLGVNGDHTRGAPRCAWTKLEESLKTSPTTTSGLCLCGGPMGDHYPSAHLCGDRLEAAGASCELLYGHGGDLHRTGSIQWRMAQRDSAPVPGSRAAAQAECDRVNALPPRPLDEPCAGCQKVARHPGEGYECMLHLRRVDPTQLAQPTGRRAVLIYELLSWINRAPVEQVEALAARTRTEGPRMACIYIAGPFSGKDGWEISENVHAAEKLAREVARLGAMPMTPHSIGAHMAGTESQTFWLAATLEMMRRCDAVLFTDDWRRSAGARGENEEAVRLGVPCFESLSGLRGWLSAGGKRDGGA